MTAKPFDVHFDRSSSTTTRRDVRGRQTVNIRVKGNT